MVNDYEEFALCIGEIDLIICLRISHSQEECGVGMEWSYPGSVDSSRFGSA